VPERFLTPPFPRERGKQGGGGVVLKLQRDGKNKIMLLQIAYFPILGLPLIAWGGIITFCLFLLTAAWPSLSRKNPQKFPFKVHKILARTALTLAFFHGLLGILIRF
jgi:cytochrome b561